MNLLDDIRLIGLAGAAGSGKDALAAQMQSWPDAPWDRIAFADALKRLCVEFLGLSETDVSTQEGKASFNEFWGMTNREVLQRVGTDAMRNGFCRDVWVRIAELGIRKALGAGRRVVVTDCRFDNEAALVRRMGGVVLRVERPAGSGAALTSAASSHASERGVSDWLVDAVVENSSTVAGLGAAGRDAVWLIAHSARPSAMELASLVERGLVAASSAELLVRLLKTRHRGEEGSVFPGRDGAAHAEWRADGGLIRAVEADGATGAVSLRISRRSGGAPEYDAEFPQDAPEVADFLRGAIPPRAS